MVRREQIKRLLVGLDDAQLVEVLQDILDEQSKRQESLQEDSGTG